MDHPIDAPREMALGGSVMRWHPEDGVCTFDGAPMVMMWIDSTMHGLMQGVRSMVGPDRFALALAREGRDSIEGDWLVIQQHPTFEEGFAAIAQVAAVAGWGSWDLLSLDRTTRHAIIRARNTWEGRLRDNALSRFGSPFLAGKVAGYMGRLFGTNCWAEQTASIAKGDAFDEFQVSPSSRSLETELDNLLATDEATRADMAVALQKLKAEIRERQSAEQQLYLAMEAAKQANRAKSEFLANMSHEIRTPMTAILGYTELLLESQALVAQDRTFLQVVQRNGKTLLRLINDLLDLSKIEFRKMTAELKRCTVDTVLSEVRSTFALKAHKKGLSLDVHYGTDLPETFETDPARLAQVLVNLVGNAIKFTATGGVTITVAMAKRDCRPFLTFAVRDTGPGIPASQLPTLFSPFSPGDQTLSKSYEGTGLGLAISKGLMDVLGGAIEVETRPGHGSTFTVWVDPGSLEGVPIRANVPRPGEPAAPSAAPTRSFPHLRGHVLVVEDTQDNRELIAAFLEGFGVTYDFAHSGTQARQKIEQSPAAFDAVLMDIQMPEMDGLTATKFIRATGWTKPIIAITAFAKPQDRDRCLEAGCNDFLSKPIARTDLYSALKRQLV